MKSLISATLSLEARQIYDSWPRQQKSRMISKMIEQEDGNMKHIEALQRNQSYNQRLISNAMIALHLKDPQHPLCKQLNEALEGTIYFQYWN